MDLQSLETELLKLTPKEKAVIIHKLIKSLDDEQTGDYEEVWIQEALNRYGQISDDVEKAVDVKLVIKEAKSKYK